MKQIKWHLVTFISLLFLVLLLNACKSIKNLTTRPEPWSGPTMELVEPAKTDTVKKNVFIIADYKLTEMFDMIAPYYIFNATSKANVYIVAPTAKPILIKKDLFVQPQLTFEEIEARHLVADVIVIPALSVRDDHQDSEVVNWIKDHVMAHTRILTICDGAATGAATGLYDGKPITCHASDYAGIKRHFERPAWTQNVSFTKSGHLYSTAGVSHAVEGSLAVIQDVFGSDAMQLSMKAINYPYAGIQTDHKSVAVSGRNKFTAIKKIFLTRNKNLAFVLENGINEFHMASMLDTYARTFPASMITYIENDTIVTTSYGLTIIHTGGSAMPKIDQVHVLTPGSSVNLKQPAFSKAKVIEYTLLEKEYPFDAYLARISDEFGEKFAQLVKISLDYN